MNSRVAVIGGGYGGAAVAKALDEETDVVLIEPKDAFVHAVGSLRALVRPDWATGMFFPYDKLLARGEVVRDRAVSVDEDGVTLASGGRVDADYLVLASGSDYAFPAKSDTDVSLEALGKLRTAHEELAGAERVLILGAGPVGLELAGEIKAIWPGKHVILADPAPELLPGFLPQVREDLRSQLDALGVELRLGGGPIDPPGEPGQAKTFTAGDVSADIWFRCHGVRLNTAYLDESLLTARGQVRVTETLNVHGHTTLYAVGDLTDLPEANMAGHAMRHADVVVENILAQVRGDQPTAVYRPSPVPTIILPLGPGGGVGQASSPDGPTVLSAQTVAERKGADLYTGRFAKLFGLV
jgi:NADH dehydrogenase FAD-containing subunit